MRKYLKYSLLAITGILSVNSFICYFFGTNFPDHYYAISSQNMAPGFVKYYLITTSLFFYRYSGIWIVTPFVLFALGPLFKNTKKSVKVELFTEIVSIALLACFAYAPVAIGVGILYYLRLALPDPYQFVVLYSLSFSILIRYIYKYRRFFKFLGKIKLPNLKASKASFVKYINFFNERKFIKKQPTFLKQEQKANRKMPLPQERTELATVVPPFVKEDITEVKGEQADFIQELRDQPATGPIKSPVIQQKEQDFSNYFDVVSDFQQVKVKRKSNTPKDSYFQSIIHAIEVKLQEFNIAGQIINVLKGPVVDTYELDLGQGVKVSKVASISEDLSMALYGAPIRIVYPIKGKNTVGIEVPRNPRELIFLDQVLNDQTYQDNSLRLPVAMGKDAFGDVMVVDLASMPHMLIAGATGAGKSVFINTLIISLIAKKSPRDMKFVLVDPKQLELALYAKLPHLVMPVITTPKRAACSLLWAVQEMERRYGILKELGVRNIEGFNEKLKNATPEMLGMIKHHYEDEEDFHLPYIVIIVDEFADLILTKAGKEIENNVCRLAAKARASGIHLVLATQRPSTEVITGLIKSNFPTRVSFRTTTGIDSRTILDGIGAEKLLGKGDMLYKHNSDPIRVHGAYVDEDEIELMMKQLEHIGVQFDQKAEEFMENGGSIEQDPYAYGSHITKPVTGSEGGSDDPRYQEAVDIVTELRAASASMLQRRLKVGYNRAANLIEMMEERGVVGPSQGAKPREVLLSKESEIS